MKITLQTNPWSLPDLPTCYEGEPEPGELERQKEDVKLAREAWEPGPDAYSLLDELRVFVGKEVRIQAWDPIMVLLEDEGPTPILANCVDLVTREVGGHIQAFLKIESPRGLSNSGEAGVISQLQKHGEFWLFNLDKLYSIENYSQDAI